MQKVLIVEDEALIAHSIEYMLKKLGYAVVGIVNNADEVMHHVAQLQPDLVLMDINLSSERDGIQIASDFHQLDDVPPVIFLTAYTDADTVGRAKEMQPFGYVVKPFQERELSICIEIALYKHRTERQLREIELRFETTLRSIGLPVVTTDTLGNLTFSNYLAARLLKLDEMPNNNLGSGRWETTLPWDQQVNNNPITYACQAGIVLSLPSPSFLHINGQQIDAAGCTISPILNEHGVALGAVLVFNTAKASTPA